MKILNIIFEINSNSLIVPKKNQENIMHNNIIYQNIDHLENE